MDFKKTQVDGKKYALPEEEVEIQKLIKKGLSLQNRIKGHQTELEAVKQRLTEIARGRRGESTTVKLSGITGASVVTFRESYEADEKVSGIAPELGSLFDRFFTRKVKFQTSKDLKQFIEGKNAFGIEEPSAMRELISQHVKKKVIKPNVKLSEK